MLNLVLSVDSLSPRLAGIGRYTWELVSRLPYSRQVRDVRFYRNGTWIDNPEHLVVPDGYVRKKTILPKFLKELRSQFRCRGRVFHGTNYFLPECADTGVITVHDLSIFKFPEMHPLERIQKFEKDFSASLKKASHIITVSSTSKSEIADFLGWPLEKITSIPLGVSDGYRPRSDEELAGLKAKFGLDPKKYLLSVSTLEPRK